MIIGIDASRANKFQKTGVEWYSYHLIQALKKISDSRNHFILYSQEPLRGELNNLPPFWQSKILKWPPKKLWTQIRLSLEMLLNPPDLLFIPSHVIPFIHPKKVITTCHDIGFEKYPLFYSKFELKYQRWAIKFALSRASHIIAVSSFTKEEIKGVYRVSGENISVIHHGYNREKYKIINDQKRIDKVLEKYEIQKPYLLYIGRLEERKNTLGLVKAFSLLKKNEYRLVLVGFPSFGFQKIQEYILKNNLRDKIIMPGWIGEDDLSCLLNKAEMFIFPSFYEGFGMPLLEAMACGAPVITSRTSSLTEVAEEAALFFDPYNPEDIAQKIKQVLENEELRNSLVQKGLERVKEFSWEKCAKNTLEMMKNIIKE